MLVALGSMPRKYESMSDPVSLDIFIKTFIADPTKNLYGITFEAINPVGVTNHIFVIRRVDNLAAKYEYSRVASLVDLANLGTSGVTTLREYLTNKVTLKTTSLEAIRTYREGVPKAVQSLLDDVKKGALELIDIEETITLQGELDE